MHKYKKYQDKDTHYSNPNPSLSLCSISGCCFSLLQDCFCSSCSLCSFSSCNTNRDNRTRQQSESVCVCTCVRACTLMNMCMSVRVCVLCTFVVHLIHKNNNKRHSDEFNKELIVMSFLGFKINSGKV